MISQQQRCLYMHTFLATHPDARSRSRVRYGTCNDVKYTRVPEPPTMGSVPSSHTTGTLYKYIIHFFGEVRLAKKQKGKPKKKKLYDTRIGDQLGGRFYILGRINIRPPSSRSRVGLTLESSACCAHAIFESPRPRVVRPSPRRRHRSRRCCCFCRRLWV